MHYHAGGDVGGFGRLVDALAEGEVEVTAIPPAIVARMASTIADISGGGFAVNIVDEMLFWHGHSEIFTLEVAVPVLPQLLHDAASERSRSPRNGFALRRAA
jgi:hypothetical protein